MAGDRPLPRALRETWQRLWFEAHPLTDPMAIDGNGGVVAAPADDSWRAVRVGGQERRALVLHTPAARIWRTRAQPDGEVRVWCAIVPGDWRRDAVARVTLRVRGQRDAYRTVTLSPGARWAHRRWLPVSLPAAGDADVSIEVAAEGPPVEVALADLSVRWRRPGAEVRALAYAFAQRLRQGGLRDTARWAQQSSRERDERLRYRAWCAKHTPDAQGLAAMARGLASWPNRPRFSILTPVYNTDPAYLEACIESVRAQVYPDWELILSDDGSTREETREVLRSYESDARIHVLWNGQNRGIAAASQAALERASGDFIALLDHDDELMPHALYRMAARLKSVPEADLLYSDEDKLELDGSRSDVYFKPDWSPDLVLSSMYVCHFLVMRRSLVVAAGGFRPGFDGSQDYDLVLRVIERAARIEHVADVLYHWRKIPQSASSTTTAKPYAHFAGQRALQEYADRNRLDAVVEDAGPPGLYRMRYRLRGAPRVSVIVAAPDEGVSARLAPPSSYEPRELVVVTRPGARAGALPPSRAPMVVVEAEGDEAERLNAGAAAATGDYFLFLGTGVVPKHADWIEALLEHAQRPEVGAVGGKLFYPDGRLRHVGLVVGPDGIGRRSFDGFPGTWAGYFSNAIAIHNRLAVSRAAVMLSRQAFERVGGWRAAVDLDVDLGHRLRKTGLRVVFTPYARFTEHAAGPASGAAPQASAGLDRDPYYNLHFAENGADYQVRVD